MDFLTIEVTSKKVRGNNLDFSTIETTLKKVCGNNVDFLISAITSKKVRGNDVDFSISKITLKKYVQITWKFVEIWSSSYRHVVFGILKQLFLEISWIDCCNQQQPLEVFYYKNCFQKFRDIYRNTPVLESFFK